MSSNVVLLEHLNLNLPRARAALARDVFLARGLGFAEDPRPRAWAKHERLLWADCGLQQLHLPLVEEGNAEGDAAPQALRGEVGLACASAADARAVRGRLAALAAEHGLAPPADGGGGDGADAFTFTCPFGTRFVVFVLAAAPPPRFMGGEADARGHPPPDDDAAAASVPRPLGFAWLRLDAPRGSVTSLADFWGATLGARTSLDASAGTLRVEVADGLAAAGAGQHLLFRERDNVPAWDGHHLCIYLRDYEAAFRRCEARGLLYDPGRFADRGGSWELAREFRQFRVLHVPPAGAGGYAALGLLQKLEAGAADPPPPVYTLELELRSLEHPSFPAAAAPQAGKGLPAPAGGSGADPLAAKS
jgi:hypothetical protein